MITPSQLNRRGRRQRITKRNMQAQDVPMFKKDAQGKRIEFLGFKTIWHQKYHNLPH